MNLKKIFVKNIFFPVVSIAILHGCSSQSAGQFNINQAGSDGRGTIAFSVECVDKTGENRTNTLNYLNSSWLYPNPLSVSFKCDGIKSIQTANAHSGEYQFIALTANGKTQTQINFPNISFSIVSGKVNYIGSIKIEMHRNAVSVNVEDDSGSDIPEVQKKLNDASSDNYVFKIMQLPD